MTETSGDYSEQNFTREAISSIELNKNSKGYTWKIKIYEKDLEVLKSKIEQTNNWAIRTYGGSE